MLNQRQFIEVNSALKKAMIFHLLESKDNLQKTSEVITCAIQEIVNNPRLPASAIQVIIQTKTGVRVLISKIYNNHKFS